MGNKATTLQVPLGAVKPIWRNDASGTILIEVPLDALREDNEPETLDDLISQARLDYAKGDYQSFPNVEDLIRDLQS
jgi:hypothetical protein